MEHGEKKKIWVSYSRDVKKQLDFFEAEVKRQSNDQIVVLSDKIIKGKYRIAIKEAIKSSDMQVLLVGKKFLSSHHCDDEVGQMILPGMKKVDIRPIALTDFNLKSPTNGSYANIDQVFEEINCYLLEDTPNAISGISTAPYTMINFAKMIVNDLGINVWENPSFIEYINSINEGRFVPFIGPGCYGLKDDWIKALPLLKAKFKKLESKLEEQNDKQFVRAVVASHLPEFYNNHITSSELQIETNYFNETSETFIDLSSAIAKAGAAASRIIGKALTSGDGLTNTRKFRVKIHANDQDLLILCNQLEAVQSIVITLPVEKDCLKSADEYMCIGSHGIAQKIGILQEHLSQLHQSNNGLTGTGSYLTLGLSQLDWLSDLLWHTLRFDLPIMPNNDEFAFHFSLCHASNCLVRFQLGTAGVVSTKHVVRHVKSHIDNIADSYEVCTHLIYNYLKNNKEVRPPDGFKFHRAIANLLLQRYVAKTHSSDTSLKSSAHEAMDFIVTENGMHLYQSMAVSVNLDTDLEYCLDDVEYSVITPVQTVGGKETAWMLRVNRPTRRKNDFYMLSKSADLSNVGEALAGPLIIKLRGSTLHELPQDGYAPTTWLGPKNPRIPNGSKIENRLLLSSLEYAREISDTKKSQPQFVEFLLSDPGRVMCFFGYPLDDPDGLLGIQHGVWIADPDNAPKKHRISIGCYHYNGLEEAFLKGLKVEPLDIDLNDVADELSTILKYA